MQQLKFKEQNRERTDKKNYEHLFSFYQGITAPEVADDGKTVRCNEHVHSWYSYLWTHLSGSTDQTWDLLNRIRLCGLLGKPQALYITFLC